jgi:septal ring factor EnvC (AmiA/AmiB activator)
VPVAKLSERFYQKFGHDLVEELVTWLNEMDSHSHTDLRELNELNFARFDAKLEQRIAEVKSDLRQEIAALRTEVLRALAALRTEMAAHKAELRTEMADLRTGMAGHKAELINWIVGCGLGAVTVLGGLMFTLFEHFRP